MPFSGYAKGCRGREPRGNPGPGYIPPGQIRIFVKIFSEENNATGNRGERIEIQT
jgi:hypothetical protein